MEGLIGLQGQIRSRENANRELGVLEAMDRRIQQDKANEVLAQQQQAAMFEEMYAKADGMLAKDRNRINKRIAMAQGQVRDHLSKYGGSQADWFANGGLSTMSQIKNDIINSEESVRYQENQKNLARILEIKEKGLGHLLTPTDLANLKAYDENEEGGTITYSGIMNEIELPPADAFDYGTEIPIENILSYKENMIKIRENYRTNYPDRPDPTYLELIAFAKKMGYGGVGSNTVRLREAYANARKRAQYDTNNKAKKGEGPGISYINEVNTMFSRFGKSITAEEIISGQGANGQNASFGSLINDPNSTAANKLLSGRFQAKSRKRKLSEEGLDVTDFRFSDGETPIEWAFNEKYGLKDGYSVLPYNTKQIAERIFETELDNGRLTDYLPDDQMYRMDGVQISNSSRLDPDDHRGAYDIVGLSTAWKLKDNQGNPMLMMDAYNDDGTLDKGKTAKINEGYKGEAKPTVVIAMKNSEGDLFYKEIEIEDPQVQTLMANALDGDDDLSTTVAQQNMSANEIAAISKNTKEEQLTFRNSNAILDAEVFNDPIFEQEGEKYYGQGSAGQANRGKLMKAWYMAFDYVMQSNRRDDEYPQGNPAIVPKSVQNAIDNEMFTNAAIQGGIEDMLKQYGQGNSEEEIISTWLKNMNADLQEGSLDYTMQQELASKWIQVLSLLNGE